jgi:predicted metal-dependent hydrolase
MMFSNLLAPKIEPASQRIVLNGEEIEFQIKRSARRRSIGLRVDFAGLVVRASARTSVKSIHTALRENADWVCKKLHAWRERTPPRAEWAQGASLPYLGGTITLNILIQPRRTPKPWIDLAGLNVAFNATPTPDQIKAKVSEWYRAEAKRYFPQRVENLAHLAGISSPRFFVSNAQARWGSCTASGEIRLTWRLLKAAPHVIDYVAAHELAHLAHMNHSPKFWQRVTEIFPSYEAARDELRRNDSLYRMF